MTDREKIRAEIERVLKSYHPTQITSGRYALRSLLSFIDSLPEDPNKELHDKMSKLRNDALSKETKDSWNEFLGEPVSGDLEEELYKWRHKHFMGKRDKGATGEYLTRTSQLDLANHFVQWQKEKMVENALEGKVTARFPLASEPCYDDVELYLKYTKGLNEGDKVKMIIIKEE